MELNRNDWVKTDRGQTGKVVSVDSQVVIVDLVAPIELLSVAYLESHLTKIEESEAWERVGAAENG